MKTRLLAALIAKTKSDPGTDQRSDAREDESGRFAGLGIRGSYHIVMMYNLSPGGACVQMPVDAKPGERIKITSGTLNRTGRVTWVEGSRGGVEFD